MQTQPSASSPARNHRHGFTLVELLVVISIIALLVGLLLPTLASARQAARIILCGSQLRQHGVGMNAYQVDFSGYYPLFGGQVRTTPDSYNRIDSIGDGAAGSDGYATFQFDTDGYNAFGSYIGLTNDNAGNTPRSSLAPIKYCPVVDWSHYGAYTFANPVYTAWTTGLPGYSYYTGRLMTGGTWLNLNTIKRRDNPREVLMTDMLMQSTETANLGFTAISPTMSWFNPHFDRSCVAVPSGSANELAADGHVVNLPFTGSIYLSGFYAISYFEGSIIGNPADESLGPPFDNDTPSDAYAITP